MPKTAYDFSKEMLFYMIKCNDESVEGVYVGSTFHFTARKSTHKTACNNEKDKRHHLKIYQTIRENGGWDNYNMNVIDRKVVIDKLEARQHEQMLIEKHTANLNSRKAFADDKDYKDYQTEYHKNHREYRKEYDKNRREYINAYMREYNKKRKATINLS